MGSPIESMLLSAIFEELQRSVLGELNDVVTSKDGELELIRPRARDEVSFRFARTGASVILPARPILVTTQCRFESYKIDILIFCTGAVVAVECDGHDWHERTKQQASQDRARDRRMATMGITVARFTGSDIVHDAQRCAVEAVALVDSIHSTHWQTIHEASDEGWMKCVAEKNARLLKNSAGCSAGLV